MTDGHTLEIATYSRPALLERLVRYYRKRAPSINLFVLDSSRPDVAEENAKALSQYGAAMRHVIFLGTVAGSSKLMDGLAQLERIDELIVRRRDIFAWYQSKSGNNEGLILNSEAPNHRNTYRMVTTVFDPSFGCRKEVVMVTLGRQGIATRPFFHPMSSFPV
jgi:hypothetical protein